MAFGFQIFYVSLTVFTNSCRFEVKIQMQNYCWGLVQGIWTLHVNKNRHSKIRNILKLIHKNLNEDIFNIKKI